MDPDLLVAELEILQHRAVQIQNRLKSVADDVGSLRGDIDGLVRNIRYREERAKEDATLDAKEIAEKESM